MQHSTFQNQINNTQPRRPSSKILSISNACLRLLTVIAMTSYHNQPRDSQDRRRHPTTGGLRLPSTTNSISKVKTEPNYTPSTQNHSPSIHEAPNHALPHAPVLQRVLQDRRYLSLNTMCLLADQYSHAFHRSSSRSSSKAPPTSYEPLVPSCGPYYASSNVR